MPIRDPQAEVIHNTLPGHPAVLDLRHSHDTGRVSGYMVVATSFAPDQRIVLTDLNVVRGAGNYGQALDLVHAARNRIAGTRYRYAITATLYGCGCRSDGILAQAAVA
jgi:hypothetical protein